MWEPTAASAYEHRLPPVHCMPQTTPIYYNLGVLSRGPLQSPVNFESAVIAIRISRASLTSVDFRFDHMKDEHARQRCNPSCWNSEGG